ncbi:MULTISPECIES: translesion error-prone DNA polymerase V subunit UmuC [Brenneria]|uniref:Translesion error-prone DNA polymerase V subunit UmuC n=1 Tax=Brenneria nigrifluens DSM 30175 = ATCC 13028 TaxID=1121120 RepID=A0A2U1UQ34_9GAMM|nr:MULTISPECIES: translesion error-prone DNA polymerase V subunit UmuC [Brenneria]EHD20688.1 DNA-directed DNA polymerase [Brenneria sp. EniD312]PWC23780.1 translesion error-prone DNA polymerase V subunit UmuC [Brenneria nigrifluens DSM 30175 = ATCC 13028]QCR03865.1 translesion error-prone DNA polymerase V subunit UmuC [Brenneria nigrifluens DSM 30175 = ATCC 13028]
MYALVDVNAFYASCETIFRPDLRGRPVVVLSNNDGCVIARSAEAKKLGIKMAMPFFHIRDLVKRYGVAVFSSNYALYADMSCRVMTILEEMAPAVEVYSIDEAFLDLTGVGNCVDLTQFGHHVRERVLREAHLIVGIGIAPTKTLAKLANFAAKQWSKTDGVVDLSNVDRQRKLLSLIPVEEVWGVGRRLSRKLRSSGIDSALQLSQCSSSYIRKSFNVVLERTVRELRGESCLDVEALAAQKQQIISSRSFSSRVTHYDDMRQAVCLYAERAAEKLRRERQYCKQVSVFIRTSPHAGNETFYSNQSMGVLSIPSNDTRDIVRVAVESLQRIWQPNCRYIKAGVMLNDFYSRGIAQLNLFDSHQPHPHSEALMSAIDKINHSGNGKIWFAGQGVCQSWAMKREMLSPAYTTRLSDIPTVKM